MAFPVEEMLCKSHWLEHWYGRESRKGCYRSLYVEKTMSAKEKSLYLLKLSKLNLLVENNFIHSG